MSREENEVVARPGHGEGSFHRGSPDVADEVAIPDYVMHDFGFPEKKRGAIPRSGAAQRRDRPSSDTL